MQTIFDSKTLPAAKRRQAWHDAICDIYLKVDCAAERRDDYHGFVRETRFGAVTLTDALCSPQSVLRQSRHIARLEKDCYFLGLAQSGALEVRQAASATTMHPGVGVLYYASEPYELCCETKVPRPLSLLNRKFLLYKLLGRRNFRCPMFGSFVSFSL